MSVITITTTSNVSEPSRSGPTGSLAERVDVGSPAVVTIVARIVAGLIGALFGIGLGLISAGHDTSRVLLAVGAIAYGLGWVIALLSRMPVR